MSQQRNTVLPWFKRYLKPTELQFKFFFNSVWFKDELIPASSIGGLNDLLNDKVDTTVVDTIQDEIEELKNKNGLQYLAAVEITANTPYELVLPANVLFYGLEVNGTANIKLGTSNTIDDLGEFNCSDTPIFELGLRKLSSIWISTDVTIAIEPIVFIK